MTLGLGWECWMRIIIVSQLTFLRAPPPQKTACPWKRRLGQILAKSLISIFILGQNVQIKIVFCAQFCFHLIRAITCSRMVALILRLRLSSSGMIFQPTRPLRDFFIRKVTSFPVRSNMAASWNTRINTRFLTGDLYKARLKLSTEVHWKMWSQKSCLKTSDRFPIAGGFRGLENRQEYFILKQLRIFTWSQYFHFYLHQASNLPPFSIWPSKMKKSLDSFWPQCFCFKRERERPNLKRLSRLLPCMIFLLANSTIVWWLSIIIFIPDVMDITTILRIQEYSDQNVCDS